VTNVTVPLTGSGDATKAIRTVTKSGAEAQAVVIDLGGAGAESLLTGKMPTSSADGDHVAIGNTNDAAWSSGAGTLVALLKKIATAGLTIPMAGTATVTSVNDTATSTTLIGANAARLGLMIFNDSTATLYVKFGTTASATSFTVSLNTNDYYELVGVDCYTGRIDGIWSADTSGAARITELTA
jgi:hypothetical protein